MILTELPPLNVYVSSLRFKDADHPLLFFRFYFDTYTYKCEMNQTKSELSRSFGDGNGFH